MLLTRAVCPTIHGIIHEAVCRKFLFRPGSELQRNSTRFLKIRENCPENGGKRSKSGLQGTHSPDCLWRIAWNCAIFVEIVGNWRREVQKARNKSVQKSIHSSFFAGVHVRIRTWGKSQEVNEIAKKLLEVWTLPKVKKILENLKKKSQINLNQSVDFERFRSTSLLKSISTHEFSRGSGHSSQSRQFDGKPKVCLEFIYLSASDPKIETDQLGRGDRGLNWTLQRTRSCLPRVAAIKSATLPSVSTRARSVNGSNPISGWSKHGTNFAQRSTMRRSYCTMLILLTQCDLIRKIGCDTELVSSVWMFA